MQFPLQQRVLTLHFRKERRREIFPSFLIKSAAADTHVSLTHVWFSSQIVVTVSSTSSSRNCCRHVRVCGSTNSGSKNLEFVVVVVVVGLAVDVFLVVVIVVVVVVETQMCSYSTLKATETF